MTPNVLFYLLSRPGALLDIGANVGQSTIGLLEVPHSRLICFEPVLETFGKLQASMINLGGGSLPPQVSLYNVALGAEPAAARIAIPLFKGQKILLRASLVQTFADEADCIAEEVTCLPLDSFMIEDATFIKLDVEGGELEALQGGRQTLERSRPILYVELEERHRPNCTKEVPAFLKSLGYTGFFIDHRDEVLPWSAFDIKTYQTIDAFPYLNNAIFIHRDDHWGLERLDLIQVMLRTEKSAPAEPRHPS